MCYYGYYMKPLDLKIARIGNSRGIRLPAATIRRYQLGDNVVMEERPEGILLRPPGPKPTTLSWTQTANEMAAAENWSDWEEALADGLDEIPWNPHLARKVAENDATYGAKPGKPRQKQRP